MSPSKSKKNPASTREKQEILRAQLRFFSLHGVSKSTFPLETKKVNPNTIEANVEEVPRHVRHPQEDTKGTHNSRRARFSFLILRGRDRFLLHCVENPGILHHTPQEVVSLDTRGGTQS